MITIKISKRFKVQKYKNNGLRIFIYFKIINKWYSLKLSEREIELLRYIIKRIREWKNIENLMNVVGNLATKIFTVIVITKNENDILLSKETKEITYLELGTYLLTHDINKIEIIEIIK